MIFFKTIEANLAQLDDKKILVHVSGGPDSIFLLHYLIFQTQKKFSSVSVLSVNYGFRPESKEELAYVEECCKKWGVENCFAYEPSVKVKEGRSVQALAREIRLQKSDEICKNFDIGYVFLAHHRDDYLETLFLKMKREASLASISQFRFQDGRFIRPLLEVPKKKILTYLNEKNIRYYLDGSNSKNIYDRNKFRLDVFPHFDKAFPSWRERFQKSFQQFQKNYFLLEKTLNLLDVFRSFDEGIFLCENYYRLFSSEEKTLILHGLLRKHFPFLAMKKDFISYIAAKVEERSFFVLQKTRDGYLVFDRDFIYFFKEKIVAFDLEAGKEILFEGEVFSLRNLNTDDEKIAHFSETKKEKGQFVFFTKSPLEKITLRKRLSSDKLYVKGLGHKKIKKIYSELSLPRLMREKSLIFQEGSEIVYVFLRPQAMAEILKQKGVLQTSFLEGASADEKEGVFKYIIEISENRRRK